MAYVLCFGHRYIAGANTMNLLITKNCNRSCPYCFAKKEVQLDSVQSTGAISLAAYQDYLTFLKQNAIRDLKILGGEPTLHPQFVELMETGLRQDFVVTVFTNGLWNRNIRSFFRTKATQNIRFLININEKRYTRDGEHAILAKTLKVTGKRAQCGFNIFVGDFDLTFLTPLIDHYSLKRTIRLGLASPIVGERNISIAPQAMKAIGKRLVRQMKILEQQDILVEFDCGFTYCMFEEDDFGTLVRSTKNGLVSTCGFIGDVDCNLDIWPCFPLSKTDHLNLKDYPKRGDIQEVYRQRFQAVQRLGSTDDCLFCHYFKRGQCCGGCLARSIEEVTRKGDPSLLLKLHMST